MAAYISGIINRGGVNAQNAFQKSLGPVEKVRIVLSFGWLFLGLLRLVDHVNAVLRFPGEWSAISQ